MRLWSWGMKNADKSGRLIYANEEVIERAIGNVTTRDTRGFAKALFECGWLDRVGEDIYIHDWDFWQKEWYKSQERREADKNRKRNKKTDEAEDTVWVTTGPGCCVPFDRAEEKPPEAQPSSAPPTPPPEPREPPEPPKAPKPQSYTPQFEELWDAYYGEKGAKAEAYKTYKARLNDGWTHQQLYQAVLSYAAQEKRNGTEKRYVKRVKTFLGPNTPFIDFLPNKGSLKREEPQAVRKNPFEEFEEDL